MDSHSGDDSADDSHTSAELGSADPLRRAKATLRLGRHGDPRALDQLLALLDDPEWRVVKATLKSLRRYRDPRIVPAVLAVAARHRSFATFARADAIGSAVARVLRSQGEAGFQALLTMLREFHSDEFWGQAVVRQLAVLRDPRAIEPLIECFDSPVYEVANAASRVMRHFGTAAIPPLIEALSITDQSPYFHVVWALRWIGAPAVPALLDALRHAEDEDIRSGAADVLDRDDIDSEDVREALYAALEDEDADVRRMAMWSLGQLGDPRVLDLLLVEQPSQGPGSLEPASTLADIGTVAVPPLIAALEDQARPAYQRVNAAHALGRIKDQRTVEPLIASLRDDDEDVRIAAISALGYLEYAEAVKPLLAVIAVEPLLAASRDDPVPEVRRRAIGELATIDDQRAFDAVAHYVRGSGEEGAEGDKSASDVLWTLALHHGERALPLLREMALGTERWRWLHAIHALSRLGAPGVSVLLEIGHEPPPQRRHLVITWLKFACGHSPDPRIVNFLFEVIQETPTSNVAEMMRYHAVLELGECGDPRAVGPLLEYLQNAELPRTTKYPTISPLGELGDERTLDALTVIYEENKAWEDRVGVGEQPGQRHNFQEFQDALVRAIAKIRTRLGTTSADEDTSGTSAAT